MDVERLTNAPIAAATSSPWIALTTA